MNDMGQFFTGDGIDLPFERFIDRETLKSAFAKNVGFERETSDGDETWVDQGKDVGALEDWAWVIEGRRGFGKSAFGSWCYQMQFAVEPPGRFIVALANPDLCANPRIGPLEAALHRLCSDVIAHLGRADKGLEFGWWSPGEVLQAICEEALHKAIRLPDGRPPPRCIVFILDNVSILPAGQGERHYQDRNRLGIVERQVAALIAEVSRLRGRPRNGKRRPAVGVLVLAYPGFYDRVGYALRSRFVQFESLSPFSEASIREFLRIYLGMTGAIGAMANTLWRLSGGIPDLVQTLTKEAMAVAIRDKSEITKEILQKVAADPTEELLSRLAEQLRDRGVGFGDMTNIHAKFLHALQSLEQNTASLSEPLEKGRLLDTLAGIMNERDDPVKRAFEHFLGLNVLVKPSSDELYAVFADAVRINLAACLNRR